MNIYQKMNAASDEIQAVPKNLTVGTGSYKYKAVAEADILKAVKTAENNHGISSFPASRKTILNEIISSEGGKNTYFIRVETVYRFVNVDKPDEFVEVTSYGDGIDSNDKAPGKAMTYADKYALMKAYKIETGDDLDARASDDLAGHDALKVGKRIEQLITALIQKGMTQDEIQGAIGIKPKDFEVILKAPQNLVALESRLRRL